LVFQIKFFIKINALTIIDKYRTQLRNNPKLDVYEWVKSEMMATTDITLDEFEEVLQIWINNKKKELSIENYELERILDKNSIF